MSKSRGRKRSSQWKIKPHHLTTCEWCGEPKRPHHVCMNCGTYRGEQVLEIEEE
ncbi:MAG: 50S ribosomal protein L32 [Anaerolineae bacterium]